jgi:hypothetical protein
MQTNMVMKFGCENNCSNLRKASASSSERSIDEVVKKEELLYAVVPQKQAVVSKGW